MKWLIIIMAFVLIASFVVAPDMRQHIYNGTEWIPLAVDNYGRLKVTAGNCVQSYAIYEFSDNAAPPKNAYWTLEGGINMNDVHGQHVYSDQTITSIDLRSRTAPNCPSELYVYEIRVNNTPITNITLDGGTYTNLSMTDRLPVNISRDSVIQIYTKSTPTGACSPNPDDLVLWVQGYNRCD